MQRYRINYHLLVGLSIGSVVLAVTSYFVWAWQIDRKAGLFRERSSDALASNKLGEAFDYQSKYVHLRPDEIDARIELSNIGYDIILSKGATREEQGMAFQVIEETVRRSGDPDLRRKLAELIIGFRPQDALGHVEELLIDRPDDPELNALKIRALFQTNNRNATKTAFNILGYDEETGEFDDDKATITDQPDIYARLAAELYKDAGERDLARRVIDRMVEVNPELASGHLRRSIFLRSIGEKEEAAAALAKAYELDPVDVGVLAQKGDMALKANEFEAAKKIFSDALEKHPDNIAFIFSLAQTELSLKNYDEANAILDRGLADADKRMVPDLIAFKIEVLFRQDDIGGVRREIQTLEKLNSPSLQPLIDLEKARITVRENKWAEAAKELKRVRPLLLDNDKARAMSGNLLGRCYERLGKLDLAYQIFDQVATDYPTYEPALRGKRRVAPKLGFANVSPTASLDQQIKEMAARPDGEQDWTEIDQVVNELIEARDFPESRAMLIRGQIMMQRKRFAEAKELITKAYEADKDDIDVRYAAVALISMDPEKGPADALALLGKLEDRWGESLRTRTLRAELLRSLGNDNLADQLHALADGIDEWSEEDRAQLMSVLGYKFQQLGQYDAASEYWAKAAALTPNSLPVRKQQFEVALRQQDEEAIRAAQQAILEFVGSKDAPDYVLSEVKRRLFGFGRRTVSREQLSETRPMLDKALAERPRWHELHAIYGKVLVVLNDDLNLALRRFDDALEYGPADPAAVATQVKILGAIGRFTEAREKMDLLSKAVREQALGRVEAEILIGNGDVDEALAAAEKVASKQSDNVQTQVWFANLCARADKLPQAVQAIRRAIELRPTLPTLWTKLVAFYGHLEDGEAMERTLREAALAIDAEHISLLAAQQYEVLGQWQSAEPIYLAVFKDRLDELPINRRMAQFYLPPNRKSQDKAAPYLNFLLRAAQDDRVSAGNPHVLWAQRQAAKYFAKTGRYQDSLKAQKLLTDSAGGGEMNLENQRLLAELLANRRDPESKLKAIRTLTAIEAKSTLEKEDVLRLARLLRDANDWKRCQELLLGAISRFQNDKDIWSTYVGMLIDRGDYGGATRQLARLRNIDARSAAYRQLSARLAAEQGDQVKLRELLEAMTPNTTGAVDLKQLGNIRAAAHMAMEYGDYEYADELFRSYANFVRNTPESVFELTHFLALYGDADEAMKLMKSQFSAKPDAVLGLAAQMLRRRRSELGDRFDADIDNMVAAAIRDDPDSVQRQMTHAEILETQQRFDACIEVYDAILKRDDMPVRMRAAAMNNLGFQLALRRERLEEADELINSAMETFGPVEDMLDTRALVRLARKQYDLAVEDMRLATSTSQDPIKYFHLAKAQILAGDDQGALKSWERAQRLGFDEDALPPQEQTDFQEIKQRIEGPPSRNAQL